MGKVPLNRGRYPTGKGGIRFAGSRGTRQYRARAHAHLHHRRVVDGAPSSVGCRRSYHAGADDVPERPRPDRGAGRHGRGDLDELFLHRDLARIEGVCRHPACRKAAQAHRRPGGDRNRPVVEPRRDPRNRGRDRAHPLTIPAHRPPDGYRRRTHEPADRRARLAHRAHSGARTCRIRCLQRHGDLFAGLRHDRHAFGVGEPAARCRRGDRAYRIEPGPGACHDLLRDRSGQCRPAAHVGDAAQTHGRTDRGAQRHERGAGDDGRPAQPGAAEIHPAILP